ncbi:hypothetical protein [Henriciella pelagia]|jgi:hypothetical protein|uniref:Uncharacterized protein n=1 Tax=Henriciella pelagia TaxID=1977912 RepID=A0ABQ1JFD2_9PROT|nr:hypothetical protein [Henriciella pelagia]GGB67536.1 hypothetical protein GCM10011503_15440 [Henriciella pelagia]
MKQLVQSAFDTLGAITFTALLSVFSAIVGGVFVHFLFPRLLMNKRHEFDIKMENHRAKLKRLELLLDREIEAADAYLKLAEELEPNYLWPGMDWHEACVRFSSDLGIAEQKLKAYLARYSFVIPDEMRKQLLRAENTAAESKFEPPSDDFEPSEDVVAGADKVLRTVIDTREELVASIRDGRSIFKFDNA